MIWHQRIIPQFKVMMDHFVKVAKNSSQYFHIPVDNNKSSEKSQI